MICERCGATENVEPSEALGLTYCGECYGALADQLSPPANGDGPAEEGSTWTPVDLGPVMDGADDLDPPPSMLARSDGEHLIYAGKIHSVVGEPESAKGWVVLHLASERLAAGEHVLYIDFEDEARTVVGRLLALGVDREAITERFHYIRPDEPLDDAGRAEIESALDRFQPTLAVIDGLTDALAIHGIDLRDNTEVANWMRELPTMMRNRGIAVVITDHVTKDSDARGRWAIGAQHKLAKVDASFHLRVEEPLGRGLEGKVVVRVEKDRPGHVRRIANGRTVAEIAAIGADNGGMTIHVDPVADREDADDWRPTGYMERVSKLIEAEPGLSIRQVREGVKGKAEYIDRARDVLIREEWIEERVDGAAHRHYSLRPYRESQDPKRVPDRVPTVSQTGHGEHLSDRVPVSPPIGDTGHGHGDTHDSDVSHVRDTPSPRADGQDASAGELTLDYRHGPKRLLSDEEVKAKAEAMGVELTDDEGKAL